MWSLGCLAAALLLGNLLYHGKSDYDIVSTSLVQHNSPSPFLCSDYMFALNVFEVNPQCDWMFRGVFVDAADNPNAGLPLKPAALCCNYDWPLL